MSDGRQIAGGYSRSSQSVGLRDEIWGSRSGEDTRDDLGYEAVRTRR